MHNELLKYCLTINKISNADLAQQTGFHHSYISKIITGGTYNTSQGPKIRRNKKIETAIATSLGLTHKQTWGKDSNHYLKQAIERALEKQMLSYSVSHTAQQVNVYG